MADEKKTNVGAGLSLTLKFDERSIKNATERFEGYISDMRTNVEKELKILSQNISDIPAEGINNLAQRLETLRNALNGATVDSNFVKVLEQLNKASKEADAANLETFAKAFEQMQKAMASGNVASNMAEQLNATSQAAKDTADNISKVTQAAAGGEGGSGGGAFSKLAQWWGKTGITSSANAGAASSANVKTETTDITALVEALNKLVVSLSLANEMQMQMAKTASQTSSATKQSAVDIEELNSRLHEMMSKGTSNYNIAQITEAIKDITEALRKVGVDDSNMVEYFNNMKKYLTEVREFREKSNQADTNLAAERELNKLYAERLTLVKQKMAATNTNKLTGEAYEHTLNDTAAYIEKIQNQIDKIDEKIAAAKKRLTESLGSAVSEAYSEKEMLAAAAAASKYAEALNRLQAAQAKACMTQDNKAISQYKSFGMQILAAQKALDKFNETQTKYTSGDVFEAAKGGAKQAEKAIDILVQKMEKLKSAYEEGFFDEVETSLEIKAAQQSIQLFEQSEKQKTAIAAQEAAQRRAEEIHQAKLATEESKRLKNETAAAATSSRAEAAASKENREIQLQQERAAAIEQVRQQIAELNKDDKNYAQDLERLNAVLTNLINKRGAGNTATRTATVEEAKAAAQTAKATKSLRSYEEAYRTLIAAMKGLDPKSAEFKELNKLLQDAKKHITDVKGAMGQLHTTIRASGDVVRKLQNSMAQYLSIGAIVGFMKKMTEVHAQFQLQNVALRAILQNKDEADRIFNQVQQMALQSPFTIMQLTTYTKQLAAYRIETEKLVDTTKMLADVSAGLGVDIQRLILAYGQVKSANYLRATEVRQFTEAGLNIAGELSQYFTELQGKMISVGDVMEMITKRMVRFEDVEEVFKRVTSAGGIFYDMQKKQSDTVYGQMQRIQDAWSMMMDDIGKSNEGTIKNALASIRTLIKNWRDLVPVVTEAVIAFGTLNIINKVLKPISLLTLKAANAFGMINLKALQAAQGVKIFGVAWKAALGGLAAGTVITVLITGIFKIVNHLLTANAALKAFREELGRISTESFSDMSASVKHFAELADIVRSATTSYEEKNEAMSELQRSYKNILPDQMLQIENIQKMKDGYTDATTAIRTYYLEQQKHKAKEALDTKQQESFTKWQESITAYASRLIDTNGLKETEAAMKGQLQRMTDTIYTEILNGDLKVEDALGRFKELFSKYYKEVNVDTLKLSEELKSYFSGKDLVGTTLYDVFGQYYDEYEQFVNRTSQAATMAEKVQMDKAQSTIKAYDSTKKAVDDYANALQAVFDLQKKGSYTDEEGNLTLLGKDAKTDLDAAIAKINEVRTSLGLVAISANDIQTAMKSGMRVQEEIQNVTQTTLTGWLESQEAIANKVTYSLKNTKGEITETFKNDYLLGWIDKMQREVKKVDLSDTQKQIRDVIKNVEQLNGVKLGDFRFAIIDSQTTVSSAVADVKKEIDSLKASIKSYQTSVAKGVFSATAEGWFLNGESIEEAKKKLEALTEVWNKFGGSEAEHTSGKDPILEMWKKRVSYIEDFFKQYKESLKKFSKTASDTRIKDAFTKLFTETGLDKISGLNIDNLIASKIDDEGLKKAFERLKALIPAQYQDLLKEIQKKISDTTMQIDLEVQTTGLTDFEKDMQELFDNYELSKTLTDLGLDIDLTYTVGGKPTTLDDVKKQIEGCYKDMLKNQKDYGSEGEKLWESFEKKLTSIENKNQQERLKNSYKYLLESVSERSQLELKAAAEINKIQASNDMDESTKNLAVENIKKKLKEDLDAQVWKDFKSSDMYVEMFENLDYASKSAISAMITRLEGLKGSLKSLPADQLKAIIKEIDTLKDKSNNLSNPFTLLAKNIGGAVTALFTLKKKTEEYNKLNERQREDKEQLQVYKDQVALISQKLADNKSTNKLSAAEVANEQEKLDKAKLSVSVLENIVGKRSKELETIKKIIKELEEEKKATSDSLDKISKGISALKSAASSLKDSFSQIFGTLSDEASDAFDTVSEILSGLDGIASGVKDIMSGNIFSGVVETISGVFATIASFFAIGDKKKARQIKKLQENVDNLTAAYKRLEKQLEKTYSFNNYEADYDLMKKNLEQQIQSYNQMIALEQSKKNSDSDAIKEYQEAVQDLKDQLEELEEQRITDLGGFGSSNYRSTAEDFVGTWLDAFKETGDGLDDLKDKWQEYMENLFIKQAAIKKAGTLYEKAMTIIDNAIDSGKSGFELESAINQARTAADAAAEDLNEYLKALAKVFGISQEGENTLSELQQGISNITESQAAAIEAYLNSIRFYVVSQDAKMSELIEAIRSQYSTSDNPMLSIVKDIRSTLNSLYDKFSRCFKESGGSLKLQVV